MGDCFVVGTTTQQGYLGSVDGRGEILVFQDQMHPPVPEQNRGSQNKDHSQGEGKE